MQETGLEAELYFMNNYQNIEFLIIGFYKMQDYLAMVMIFKLQPIQTIIWQK